MTLLLKAFLRDVPYSVTLERPHDLSIPIRFDGPQVSVFGGSPADKKPLLSGRFIGAVDQGGSCNCDVVRFAPHTNGTHTECVGHIADRPIAVCDMLQASLIPATLITIEPEAARDTSETYNPPPRPDDPLLTRARLEQALQGHRPEFLEALVIRTIPNDAGKRTRDYSVFRPPFFSVDGIRYLAGLPVQHLLVDMPSIDRLDDEGKLTNHHIFWNVPQGSHAVDAGHPSPKTITELIYVPNDLTDGSYLLNLQIAPFMADAAPSRPVLYEIERA